MDTIQVSERLTFVVAPEVKKLTVAKSKPGLQIINELADKHHWTPPEVIGRGAMISSPVVCGKWRYEPLNLDDPIIPKEAVKRINLILKSDVQVQGWVIAHELETEPEIKLPEVDWEKVKKAATIAGLAVAGVAAVAMLTPAVMLLGALAMVDPMIICVTEEEEWIKIILWYS